MHYIDLVGFCKENWDFKGWFKLLIVEDDSSRIPLIFRTKCMCAFRK